MSTPSPIKIGLIKKGVLSCGYMYKLSSIFTLLSVSQIWPNKRSGTMGGDALKEGDYGWRGLKRGGLWVERP
jgi:hypothetical protein